VRYCPKCKSTNIATERRLDGDTKCLDCNHKASTKEFPMKQSPDRISYKEFGDWEHKEYSIHDFFHKTLFHTYDDTGAVEQAESTANAAADGLIRLVSLLHEKGVLNLSEVEHIAGRG